MKNKSILMTGATGYLGSYLTQALIDEGCDLLILKRSWSDMRRLEKVQRKIKFYDIDKSPIDMIFENNHIDMIIHCATDYGRSHTDPVAIVETNLLLPLKIIEAAKKRDVFFFINTDTILGKHINYYSLSKKQFRDWLYLYSEKMVCINIILDYFYGPYDDKTKLVSFIIDKMLSGAPSIDMTAGEQKRDFIYIDDVVSAFIKVIQHVDASDRGVRNYEIGTNKPIKINELARLLKCLSGNNTTKLNFGALPYRENEVMESEIDTKAIKSIGWAPKYSLNDGLLKTITLEKEAYDE